MAQRHLIALHVRWRGSLRAPAFPLALVLPLLLPLRNETFAETFGELAFLVIVRVLAIPWLLQRAQPDGL